MNTRIDSEHELWQTEWGILQQADQQNGLPNDGYAFSLNGNDYKIVRTPTIKSHAYGEPFRRETVLTLAFNPLPEDGLRFVEGVEQPKLPVVRIWGNEWGPRYSYVEFKKGIVERTNLFTRMWERFSAGPEFTLDQGKGQVRIMNNLADRLKDLSPTSFTPLSQNEIKQLEQPVHRSELPVRI